jgi:hypothetical protein
MAKGYPDYRKFSVPIAVVEGGTGTDAPTLAPGAGIEITGSWPNHTIINTSPASALGDPVTVAHGGTGTADGSITGTGALTFAAGGAAQDVTLLPSTTGKVVHGSATTTPTIRTWGGGGYSDHTVDGGNVYNIPQLRVTSSLYLTNPLAVAYGGTGEAAPSLVAGSGISITGTWPDQTVTNTSPASTLGDPVAVAHGGTGEAAPSLVAGSGISISGTWPDQTVTNTSAGGGAPSAASFVALETDFAFPSGNLALCAPWLGLLLSSGTLNPTAGSANHPGIVQCTSSATGNSGGTFYLNSTGLLLAGGETTELVFWLITTTDTTVRFGFQDSFTSTAPVDGAWINIAGTTLTGKTRSNSTESITGTSYTITANTWYRVKVVINADATRVDFYLYDAAGTQLWTDYLTTNIPTATGRETGHGVVATNAGTTAKPLVNLDYMNLSMTRTLTR